MYRVSTRLHGVVGFYTGTKNKRESGECIHCLQSKHATKWRLSQKCHDMAHSGWWKQESDEIFIWRYGRLYVQEY